MRALLEGRFDEGEQLAREAFVVGRREFRQDAALVFMLQSSAWLWDRGCLEELEAPLRAQVEQFPNIPVFRCGLVTLYSELGREKEAARVFGSLAGRDFADLPRDATWLSAMAYLSMGCAFLGDIHRAAILYELLQPHIRSVVIAGPAAVCLGSVSRYLGLLAATRGEWETARGHLEDALEMNTRLRARPLVARTQYDYAQMLLCKRDASDAERARDLLHGALDTARGLGMKGLEGRIVGLTGEVEDGALVEARLAAPVRRLVVAPAASPERAGGGAAAQARRGVVMSFPARADSAADHDLPARAAGTRAGPAPPPNTAVFRQEGEYWTISYQGNVFRLKDALGLRYLAQLLQHPGRDFLAADMVAPLGESGRERPALGDAGEVLDAQARSAYERRLEDLRDQIEEARSFNDPERVSRARAEMDFLADELARAVGLGGRPRRAASHLERARLNVTRRIRFVLDKIAAHDASLGRYLATTVKTGTFCSYTPDPRFPLSWVF
jgi:tetratricopeptide (TPR) repeat protein